MTNIIGKLSLAAFLLAAGVFLHPSRSQGGIFGVIYPEACDYYDEAYKSMVDVLSAGGFGSGKYDYHVQKPAADPMSWMNSFRKFVQVDADIIIVFGDNLLEIACRHKTKIPVIFGFATNPEETSCIKSIDKPGRNVTGVRSRTPLFTLLDKSKKINNFKKIGVLVLKGDSVTEGLKKKLESLQSKLGFEIVSIPAAKRGEMASALKEAPGFDLLLFPNCPLPAGERSEIANIAKGRKTPIVSLQPSKSGEKAMVSMYPDPATQGKLIGEMAAKVLGGQAPGKTPILTLKKMELEIDLGQAKSLGLQVPLDVLNSATKISK